jgi:hypothetical protein
MPPPSEDEIVRQIMRGKSGSAQALDLALSEGQYPFVTPEPTDQDIVKIAPIMKWVHEEQKKARNQVDIVSFGTEIVQRFADEAGIWVSVSAKPIARLDNGLGMYEVTVEMFARTAPYTPDMDQQVYDVVNDTLGTGKKGWIPSPSDVG